MKGRKAMIVLLTAVMLFVIGAPSFAANRMETDGQKFPEQAEEADGSEDAEPLTDEEDEQTEEAAEGETQTEDGDTEIPEETPVPKKTEGIEVNYTAYKENLTAVAAAVFSVDANGTTYTGTCARQGVSLSESGTARITKIPNSEKIAKVIYHYAIELGDENWWDSPACSDRVGKIIGMSSVNSTRVT